MKATPCWWVLGVLGLGHLVACGAEGGNDWETTEEAESFDSPVAFPGRTGVPGVGVFETPRGRMRLHYQEIDGLKIHQGDIILGFEVPEDALPEESGEALDSPGAVLRGAVTARPFERWQQGIIPFSIDATAPNHTRIREAIQQVNDMTSLTLVESETANPRIRFVLGSGCSSSVGSMRVVQAVNLSADCTRGDIIHEIGHVAGLMHTHQRADRDEHVIFDQTCLADLFMVPQYQKYTTQGIAGFDVGPYEVDSLMHYNSHTFSKQPHVCHVLTLLDGSAIRFSKSELRPGDLADIEFLYGEHASPASTISTAVTKWAVGSSGKLARLTSDGRVSTFTNPSGWASQGTETFSSILFRGSSLHAMNSAALWKRSGGTWVPVSPSMDEVVADDSSNMYARDSGSIFRYVGSDLVIIGGPATGLVAGGQNLFKVDSTGVFRWTGKSTNANTWTKVGGPGHQFAVDNYGTLYGMSPQRDRIYRYTGSGQTWTGLPTGLATPLTWLSAGVGRALVVDALGKAWTLGTDSKWLLVNVGPVLEFRERDLMAVIQTNPDRELRRLTRLF